MRHLKAGRRLGRRRHRQAVGGLDPVVAGHGQHQRRLPQRRVHLVALRFCSAMSALLFVLMLFSAMTKHSYSRCPDVVLTSAGILPNVWYPRTRFPFRLRHNVARPISRTHSVNS